MTNIFETGKTMQLHNNRLLTFILAVGVFGILNTEMGVVGIIPDVASNFQVSVPQAALLVSGFAFVVAVAGPTMPLLFSKANRKTVMLLSLGVFTVCNAASIFAPSFEALLILRVVPAAFHPLYVSMALALASSNPDPKKAARASAIVFVGVSAGMVVGAPVANLLASAISLEASMAFFAVVTTIVFIATVFFVPSIPVKEGLTYGKQVAILKKPILWASMLSVVALNGAMFGFYGFMSDYLANVTGLDASGVSLLLLVYGVVNMVGNMVAGGTLASGARQTVVAIPFALAASFAALFAFGQLTFGAAAAIVMLGLFVGVGNNVNQYLVSTAAPEAPDFANGLFLTAANLGITVGTPVCGIFITNMGIQFSIFGTFIMLCAAVVLITLRQSIAKRSQRCILVDSEGDVVAQSADGTAEHIAAGARA